MSSSWKLNCILTIIHTTPSPTLQSVLSNRISRTNKIGLLMSSMEKISLFIFRLGKKRVCGSMTVEASLLLPLLLFFFLHLMGLVEMLRLHSNMTFGLWECGKGLVVYNAMPGELIENIPDAALSYLYVKEHIEAFLGEEYLDNSPLVRGKDELNYIKSSYEDGYIDIGVTYEVEPPISIFSFPYMRMVNRYYAKDWSGYEISPQIRYVYVTIYGKVWHTKADCSHIFITVQETNWRNINQLRNLEGGKYYSCELCKEQEKGDKVYYTPYGSRYHRDRECSSLVRYIRAVLWQDNMPYPPCSRCVEKE